MIQPVLLLGAIPPDPDLRRALLRLAARAEAAGPAGIGIDASMPDGRQAWQDLLTAIWWIYDHAIEPDLERGAFSDGPTAAAIDG